VAELWLVPKLANITAFGRLPTFTHIVPNHIHRLGLVDGFEMKHEYGNDSDVQAAMDSRDSDARWVFLASGSPWFIPSIPAVVDLGPDTPTADVIRIVGDLHLHMDLRLLIPGVANYCLWRRQTRQGLAGRVRRSGVASFQETCFLLVGRRD
jgi:hypothetical protein